MTDTANTDTDTFRDENGYALADYNETTDGHYSLVGINVWGGWYYSPAHHRIANYKREREDRNAPMTETDEALTDLPDGTSVGAFVAGAGGPDGRGEWDDAPEHHERLADLTTFGAAMHDAHRMMETGVLARRQAECVALADGAEMQAWEAGDHLGIAVKTVRNTLTRARERIDGAHALVEILGER